MSLRVTPETPEENAHSQDSAAPGAAVNTQNTPIGPDLELIIQRWPDLSQAVQAGILTMIRAAR
jgi:hypothetical protein